MTNQDEMIEQILEHVRTNTKDLLQQGRELQSSAVGGYLLGKYLSYSNRPNLQDLVDIATVCLARHIQYNSKYNSPSGNGQSS